MLTKAERLISVPAGFVPKVRGSLGSFPLLLNLLSRRFYGPDFQFGPACKLFGSLLFLPEEHCYTHCVPSLNGVDYSHLSPSWLLIAELLTSRPKYCCQTFDQVLQEVWYNPNFDFFTLVSSWRFLWSLLEAYMVQHCCIWMSHNSPKPLGGIGGPGLLVVLHFRLKTKGNCVF